MIITKIQLFENNSYACFNFTPFTNIIFSEKNTAGKTSLVKLILFSLGYPIDRTTLSKFKKCKVKATIENNDETMVLTRTCDEFIYSKDQKTIQIPKDHESEFLAKYIGLTNDLVIKNLLGVHYISQDKGWTVYNKGQENSFKFDIDEMILGLSNINCTDLLQKKQLINKEIERNRQILKMIKKDSTNMIFDLYSSTFKKADLSPLDEIQKELDQENTANKVLKNKLAKLQNILDTNQKMLQLILDMKVVIKVDNKRIPITKENLDYYEDNELLLKCQIESINKKIKKCEDNIQILLEKQKNIVENINSYSLIKSLSVSPVYNSSISSTELNKTISILSEEYQRIVKIIEKELDEASLYTELDLLIQKYAKELGVGDEIKRLKCCSRSASVSHHSGAIRMMLVLSYRLAYLEFMKTKLSVSLPFIIDSPAQELDEINLNLMLNVLKEHFSDYQIIIATTAKLNIFNSNVITLHSKERLINKNIPSQKKIEDIV